MQAAIRADHGEACRFGRRTCRLLISAVAIQLVEDAASLCNQPQPFMLMDASPSQSMSQYRSRGRARDLPQSLVDYLEPRQDGLIIHGALHFEPRWLRI